MSIPPPGFICIRNTLDFFRQVVFYVLKYRNGWRLHEDGYDL
jgi:hypothetical protein